MYVNTDRSNALLTRITDAREEVRYLAMRPDGRLMMSPTKVEYPETIVNSFNKDANWKEFYGEMIKEDPAGMPTPLGQSVRVGTFLDADHAGNVVIQTSLSLQTTRSSYSTAKSKTQ